MPTDKPRIVFAIGEEMNKKIEDIWYGVRFRSQSEAVRYLVMVGMEQVMEEMSMPDGLEKLHEKLKNVRCNNLDDTDRF
jgi:Arc/MetJ-type ribon-helix-helix transcriptional regulator